MKTKTMFDVAMTINSLTKTNWKFVYGTSGEPIEGITVWNPRQEEFVEFNNEEAFINWIMEKKEKYFQ